MDEKASQSSKTNSPSNEPPRPTLKPPQQTPRTSSETPPKSQLTSTGLSYSPGAILQLQSLVGNKAVHRLISQGRIAQPKSSNYLPSPHGVGQEPDEEAAEDTESIIAAPVISDPPPDHPDQKDARSSRIPAVLKAPKPYGQQNILQAKRVTGVIGQRVAAIADPRNGKSLLNITLESEIIPDGQSPKRFKGLPDRLEALALALQENVTCIVAEDHEHLFHAYRTNMRLFPEGVNPSTAASEMSKVMSKNFVRVDWVGGADEEGQGAKNEAGSWQDRVDAALEWYRQWKEHKVPSDIPIDWPKGAAEDKKLELTQEFLEKRFVGLLAEALGISPDWIYVKRSDADRIEGKIGFDINMKEAQGEGGIGSLPEKRDDLLRKPVVSIGPNAFIGGVSRLYLLGTVVHETKHYQHGRQANQLWQKWKKSGSDESFAKWLGDQRAAKKISSEVYNTTLEKKVGGERYTQIFAHVQGFIASYSRLPLTEPKGAGGARFSQLGTMLNVHWPSPKEQQGSAFDTTALDRAITLLADYYDTLPLSHKVDFMIHLNEQEDFAQSRKISSMIDFWSRMRAALTK